MSATLPIFEERDGGGCSEFERPQRDAPGRGDCDTDGHYQCQECRHISRAALLRHQGRCDDCGEKLSDGDWCEPCDRRHRRHWSIWVSMADVDDSATDAREGGW